MAKKLAILAVITVGTVLLACDLVWRIDQHQQLGAEDEATAAETEQP